MRAIAEESVFLAMPSEAPNARNLPVVVIDDSIRAALEEADVDCSRINTLRWSFIGAAHPSRAFVLLDITDADSAAIMSGPMPLSLHLSDSHAVQMWPIRMQTLRYATSGFQSVSALRLLELTDERGLPGVGAGFGSTEFGQPGRDQPRVINQTLDMPLHFAGVSLWATQTRVDTSVGKDVTIKYQGAGQVTKLGAVPGILGIDGQAFPVFGGFTDGRAASANPVIRSGLATMFTGGSEAPAQLNAPIDFPSSSGGGLEALDAMLSLRGWMMAYVPSWTTSATSVGTVPINPARQFTPGAYQLSAAVFLGYDAVANVNWYDHAVGGAFASVPSAALVGQGYLANASQLFVLTASGLPAQTIPISLADGAVADLVRGLPDYVIPTLTRSEVTVDPVGPPESLFDYAILPAARTSGLRLNQSSAQVQRRRWQFSAIPPNGTPEKTPNQGLGGFKVLRIDITDHAIIEAGSTTDTPINSSGAGLISGYIQSHFEQGLVETNARRAAQDFYGRFLIPCGEWTFHGLMVFDQSSWWPGIQYAEYAFANGGMSTTRVWGDFWHPAFGFVPVANEGGRWRLASREAVAGVGSVGVDHAGGVARVRGDLTVGHLVARFMGCTVDSAQLRADATTSLGVAWAYRVRISRPDSKQYGMKNLLGQFVAESSANLIEDKNYSEVWVPNLMEVSNGGGNSLHGSGTRVKYSPAPGEPQIISMPVRNGIPVEVLAFQTDGGGVAYAINIEGPYQVNCTEAASLVEPTQFDPFAWFSAGLVTSLGGSSSVGGESASGAACGCGGAS